MANTLKLPRRSSDASSRELDVINETFPRDKGLRSAVFTDKVADPKHDRVRRLVLRSGEHSERDSVVRLKRIEAIRKAIEAGTYRISAAAIAEKLVEYMLNNRSPRTDETL